MSSIATIAGASGIIMTRQNETVATDETNETVFFGEGVSRSGGGLKLCCPVAASLRYSLVICDAHLGLMYAAFRGAPHPAR
jgi:hypothetical protein